MSELQAEIIEELNVKPNIEPRSEIDSRIEFMTQYLIESGRNGFTLGISGGQDSLLAGYIAQNAVNRAIEREGRDMSFHALLLPYGEQADRQDAVAACDFIDPDYVHDFQIKKAVDAFAESYGEAMDHEITDYDKGNVKARTRMVAQYAIASKFGLLVIGTDHAAEAVTGFFTKHGDGAADVLPLAGLNKRQGRELLECIDAPEVFVTKKPTADLLDSNPGQTDEFELGITYDDIDDYLEGKDIDEAAASAIEARFTQTRHKREVPVAYE